MGEWMNKMLPEMKAAGRSTRPVPPESKLLSDEQGRKYYELNLKCAGCGQDYKARNYILNNGWTWNTGKTGYCQECSEKRAAEFYRQEKEKADAELIGKRESWRVSCGIPLKYRFKGFQHFEQSYQPKAFMKCQDYAQKFPIDNPQSYPSLVLYSDHTWGTGKTHLACSIAHHILSRWAGEPRTCPVKFVSEPVLFESIRETYNFSFQEKEQLPSAKNIIDSCIRVPLLILDDLGKEEVSDLRFVQRTLFSIFDGRYNAELPVVVTANLNDAGLRSHMGGNAGNEASFNRLFEMCKGEFVHMDGQSYRDKLARVK
jgi:DNA replication protein DnaC